MPTANVLVLDTHAWLEVALGRERGFSPRIRRQVEAATASRLYVAAITPWEIAALARKGPRACEHSRPRVRGGSPSRDADSVASLDPEIAVDAVELPAWDHRDPADRMIVASARNLQAMLVTRDAAILQYASAIKAVRAVDPRA